MESLHRIAEPKVESFPRMLQCRVGILREIFKFYQLGEIGVYIGKECIMYEYNNADPWPVPILARKRRGYFQEMIEDHCLVFDDREFASSSEAWDYIRDTLDKGILSIIKADAYHIPYCPMYGSEHQTHFICLSGISDERDTVYIYDTSYRKYHQEAPRQVVENAWKEANYKIISVLQPTQIRKVDYNSFLSTMKSNAENMLNPDYKHIYENNTYMDSAGDYSSYKAGVDAIVGFGQILQTIPYDEKFKENLINTYIVVSDIMEQTELHLIYLASMVNQFNLRGMEQMIDDIKYLSQEWMLLKNMLVKAAYRNSEEILSRCSQKVFHIADQEKRFFHDIANYISYL